MNTSNDPSGNTTEIPEVGAPAPEPAPREQLRVQTAPREQLRVQAMEQAVVSASHARANSPVANQVWNHLQAIAYRVHLGIEAKGLELGLTEHQMAELRAEINKGFAGPAILLQEEKPSQ